LLQHHYIYNDKLINNSFYLYKISNDKEFFLSSSLTADDASSLNSINPEQECCLVVQYHYTQWKDMDVPNDSHTLLHLIREVNEQTSSEQYPIVVHCTYEKNVVYLIMKIIFSELELVAQVHILQSMQ
jgi:protein tyrosine phosphatase